LDVKGFIFGTIVLVALEVVLTSTYGLDNLQNGTNLFSRGLKRMLAPDVAGIPNRAAKTTVTGNATGSSYTAPTVTNPYISTV
jgi:hypothetical protein